MPRYLRADRVRALQLTALANGGRLATFADGTPSRTVEWDISGKCQSPVTVEVHGRAERKGSAKMLEVTPSSNRPNFVTMEVRCRKCERCLRQRSMLWRYRIQSEYSFAARTWLATLTLRPEVYADMLNITRCRLVRKGVDLEALEPDAEWLEVERVGFEEVTKWIKRLKTNSGVPLRRLIVTEAHKSGVPHWHVLIHEQDAEKPIRHRQLSGSWPLGWDSYKLVNDHQGASYVAKYLGKELRARVRASEFYGAPVSERNVAPAVPP